MNVPRCFRRRSSGSWGNWSPRRKRTRCRSRLSRGRCSPPAKPHPTRRRRGGGAARHSFSGRGKALALRVRKALLASHRTEAARSRLTRSRACFDAREWVTQRRERTRHLIELGGLLVKAGIVDLVDDDRAVIFGALLE